MLQHNNWYSKYNKRCYNRTTDTKNIRKGTIAEQLTKWNNIAKQITTKTKQAIRSHIKVIGITLGKHNSVS